MMSAEFNSAYLQAARPRSNPWLIAVAVMSVTFLELLDTSATNVALRHVAGSFASSADEATWVQTSYLISNAIVLVASGWLSRSFGQKRVLIVCIVIFTGASAICGVAPSLACLIVARVIQGLGGGGLQPIAQAILLENFPFEKRGQGMCLYTIGVMVAPLIGPTVGGWITDNHSWRWVFYINIPVGVAALLMMNRFLEDPLNIRNAGPGRLDAIGFSLMALGLATLQIILDKGQQDDWFEASWIRWATVISVISLLAFAVWELRAKDPIVNLRVLRNRNFALSAMLVTVVSGAAYYGTITVLPLFLERVLSYTAAWSGETLAARGVGALVGTVIVGRLIAKTDARLLMSCGVGLLALSVYLLGEVNSEVSQSSFLWPCIFNGFAFGLISAPLTTAAVSTLRPNQIGNATAIFNLVRNVGGSIGVSVVNTQLARRAQSHQATLASRLTPYDRLFRQQLRQAQGLLGGQRAYGVFYSTLLNQAALLAFIDVFRLIALVCLVCAPLALFFEKAGRRAAASEQELPALAK
jgi:DHA2 family multidrug resistance protein